MATAACQIPINANVTCVKHGEPLSCYCKKCRDPVYQKHLCSLHRSHIDCELDGIYFHKHERIKSIFHTIVRDDPVKIKTKLSSADTLLRNNSSSFDELTHEVEKHTEKLKQKLNDLRRDTLSLYQNIKTDNAKLIEKYKTDLETYERHLEQQQRWPKQERFGMELELYNESCEIVSVPSFPVRPFLTTATFTPNNSYHVLLEVAFGKATTSSEGQTLATRKTLLSDTKVFEYCEFVSNVDDIRPTIDGLMWIREGSVLTLMDKTGQKIQKIVHTAKIIDICISPTSHSLWICDKKKNVMKLGLDILPRRIFTQLTNKLKHKEEPELRHFAQMFRTKKKPRCMCITGSDHVIVGMTNQLSKFTTKGEQVLTTMAASLIKPEVSTPHRVAECPVTHNVAVIDSNDADDSHKHVVVLNADFIKLFVCRNDITFLENTELELLKCEPDEAKYLHYINDLNSPLCPQDVMYDSEGNLLIVHKKPLHRQYRILLFNGGGNFRIGIHHESHMRRTHMRRNERPSVWVDKDDHDSHIQCNERPSVCIDKDDIVWVADKELLEVQYSQ